MKSASFFPSEHELFHQALWKQGKMDMINVFSDNDYKRGSNSADKNHLP